MLFKPSFNLKSILKTFKRHWKMSKYLIGSALMQWTSGNYFIIVAGVLLGPVSVGALRAASNIIGVTNILLQGLENIVPQSASKHLVGSGIFGLKSYLKKIFFLGGSVILLIAAILILFSSEILVTLYGDDFSEYSYVLVWYSITSLIVFSLTPLFIGLRTLENTKPIFISYLITTIFSISAANVLIKEFEVNGVMIGILINSIIMVFISYRSFLKTCRTQLENENDILKQRSNKKFS